MSGIALLMLTGCSAQSDAASQPIDEPTIVGELPSVAEEPSPSADDVAAGTDVGSDDERMWEVCYAPLNSVGQVTSHPNIINSLLDDYPAEWQAVAPIPTAPVEGVCRKFMPASSSQNDWWVHFADKNAGYEAALAWRDQLVSAGATGGCVEGFELGQGAGTRFDCSYALGGGWSAGLINPFGPVELTVQEPMR